jgi:hypothetical protein
VYRVVLDVDAAPRKSAFEVVAISYYLSLLLVLVHHVSDDEWG